jgi:predicted GIY-YIG superfamily endonuclease
MLYYVYVIRSLSAGIFYTGMSSDINNRLKEHNSGKSKFTSTYKPWKLVYQEGPFQGDVARKREKYLKSAAGKKYLKSYIGSSNRGSLPE